MRRYVFIGAGAIGSALGGLLAAAGSSVVLVGRPAHVEAINEAGLRLRTPEYDRRVEVMAVTSPGDLRLEVDDVLVLTTKTHQATAALAEWADAEVFDGDQSVGRAWERLPICTALNGVTSESMALRYFRRVFAVCVWMPAAFLEAGEVLIRASPRRGVFHLGAAHHSPGGEPDPLLVQLQRDCRAAECEAVLTDAVMAWKFRKLISNVPNAIQALLAADDDPTPFATALDAEARDVLDAAKIGYVDDATEQAAREESFTMRSVPGEPAEIGGSSWQSLARGSGSIESDYLNGEIARLGRAAGHPAPLNEKLASLARVAAREGQRPGAMNSAELSRALGL